MDGWMDGSKDPEIDVVWSSKEGYRFLFSLFQSPYPQMPKVSFKGWLSNGLRFYIAGLYASFDRYGVYGRNFYDRPNRHPMRVELTSVLDSLFFVTRVSVSTPHVGGSCKGQTAAERRSDDTRVYGPRTSLSCHKQRARLFISSIKPPLRHPTDLSQHM